MNTLDEKLTWLAGKARAVATAQMMGRSDDTIGLSLLFVDGGEHWRAMYFIDYDFDSLLSILSAEGATPDEAVGALVEQVRNLLANAAN